VYARSFSRPALTSSSTRCAASLARPSLHPGSPRAQLPLWQLASTQCCPVCVRLAAQKQRPHGDAHEVLQGAHDSRCAPARSVFPPAPRPRVDSAPLGNLTLAHLCRLHRVFGGGVRRVRATHVSGKQALLSLRGRAALVLRVAVRARPTSRSARARAPLLIVLLPVAVQVLAQVRVGVFCDAPDPARLGSDIHEVR
jgi:hypothetical protein